MKNKKGISFGRIILYILFLSLIALFIWTLYVTFKAMKKNDHIDNSVKSSLRMVDNNSSIVRNLYDNSTYPFYNLNYNGTESSIRGFTGAFIYLAPGTYSLSVSSSFLNDGYSYQLLLYDRPGYSNTSIIVDDNFHNISSYTYTFNVGGYAAIFVGKGGSSFSASSLNSYDFMLNEGQSHSYVAFDNNFANAIDYITNCYFTGYASFVMPEFYGQTNSNQAIGEVYFPVHVSGTYEHNTMGLKTNYQINTYNGNDLFIGTNVSDLYNDINGVNWSLNYYTYNITYPYSSTTTYISVYYECNIPIPVNYFSFMTYGSDVFGNSTATLFLKCNDNITIYLPYDNTAIFNSQMILNVNPNVTSVYEFGFIIYNTNSSTGLSLQNNSWSTYETYCDFHIIFNNYYGDSIWQEGYDEGFRQGQSAADEGLRNNNISLQNQVNDLTNSVSDLTSRVNQQSEIITQLRNELDSSSNNFKGLFFTFADIPFRTVANALGFEFWGVNLFRFFVGIITALGILWLIKRLYK